MHARVHIIYQHCVKQQTQLPCKLNYRIHVERNDFTDYHYEYVLSVLKLLMWNLRA